MRIQSWAEFIGKLVNNKRITEPEVISFCNPHIHVYNDDVLSINTQNFAKRFPLLYPLLDLQRLIIGYPFGTFKLFIQTTI